MVIVVQSNLSSWESHLQCNGQPILWDLRRPIKVALGAVSEHLAGLLPLHLVYSQAHETAIEDWIWSVGFNPLSVTSQGWHVSQFQTDNIARSYVLTTLEEESILLVNSAIHLLLAERTLRCTRSCHYQLLFLVIEEADLNVATLVELPKADQTFKLFQSHERELMNKYNDVVSLWKRISTVTGELRYAEALILLNLLDASSKRFADYVNVTVTSLHPIHCTRQRKLEVEFDMTTIPAFLVVIFVLCFVLKPRRPKPKIN